MSKMYYRIKKSYDSFLKNSTIVISFEFRKINKLKDIDQLVYEILFWTSKNIRGTYTISKIGRRLYIDIDRPKDIEYFIDYWTSTKRKVTADIFQNV